ncbi:MAG TPA: ectonucleotide pyrophosphatase/phosphodiesterase [Pyrinomonadaceae bacterium]|nr:ectonucleotide pyrophosphatase/phosphodiesterase [Pyrinomonadaceae bacterium]
MRAETRLRPRLLAAVLACLCLSAPGLAPSGARRADAAETTPAQSRPNARAARVLVVSIDGLDARYLRDADRHGLKIPTLRRLMAAGAWSRAGVVGVYPSVTYPSHTTLVTGARPSRHGVYGNGVFEPPPKRQTGAWYWFARDIKADTLWQAAARRGLKTALVSWPVSTGAGDWNVPEIWQPGGTQEESRARMSEHARPAGLLEEVARADARLYGAVTRDEGDDMRTRFAEYLLAEKRPRVALVHLFDLDHFEHDYGPFTAEAFALLEKSDAYLARILAAAERAGTLAETAVFVVSDHGFRPVTKAFYPNVALERAGLLKWREERDARGATRRVVGEWRAVAYTSAAYAAVILKDPNDRDALRRALAAFRDYEPVGGDGGGPGVLRVVGRAELNRLGADPRAAFTLDPTEGFTFEGGHAADVVADTKSRGQHGHLPGPADFRASFVASGAGVARRGDLGEVRMIDIGPTIARTLGLSLRDAEGRPLRLR